MSSDAFVGIDLGTSGVRSLAVDGAGALIGTASREVPPRSPGVGLSEQDPDDWWAAA